MCSWAPQIRARSMAAATAWAAVGESSAPTTMVLNIVLPPLPHTAATCDGRHDRCRGRDGTPQRGPEPSATLGPAPARLGRWAPWTHRSRARPPPGRAGRRRPFRLPSRLRRTEERGPRLVRVTLGGPALEGFPPAGPAASVRVLLPAAGRRRAGAAHVGRQRVPPARRRPAHHPHLDAPPVDAGRSSSTSRSWCTGRVRPRPGPVGAGRVSRWRCRGPGRGYVVDAGAPPSSWEATRRRLPRWPSCSRSSPGPRPWPCTSRWRRPKAAWRSPTTPGVGPDGGCGRPRYRPGRRSWPPCVAPSWCRAPGCGWRARRRPCSSCGASLFEERGVPRAHAAVRGYWKHGRRGGADDG